MNLKEHVTGKVKFQFYKAGNLYYQNEKGLVFPVPIEDIGEATFVNEDKALLFMRYIRRHLDTIKSGAV